MREDLAEAMATRIHLTGEPARHQLHAQLLTIGLQLLKGLVIPHLRQAQAVAEQRVQALVAVVVEDQAEADVNSG